MPLTTPPNDVKLNRSRTSTRLTIVATAAFTHSKQNIEAGADISVCKIIWKSFRLKLREGDGDRTCIVFSVNINSVRWLAKNKMCFSFVA